MYMSKCLMSFISCLMADFFLLSLPLDGDKVKQNIIWLCIEYLSIWAVPVLFVSHAQLTNPDNDFMQVLCSKNKSLPMFYKRGNALLVRTQWHTQCILAPSQNFCLYIRKLHIVSNKLWLILFSCKPVDLCFFADLLWWKSAMTSISRGSVRTKISNVTESSFKSTHRKASAFSRQEIISPAITKLK